MKMKLLSELLNRSDYRFVLNKNKNKPKKYYFQLKIIYLIYFILSKLKK